MEINLQKVFKEAFNKSNATGRFEFDEDMFQDVLNKSDIRNDALFIKDRFNSKVIDRNIYANFSVEVIGDEIHLSVSYKDSSYDQGRISLFSIPYGRTFLWDKKRRLEYYTKELITSYLAQKLSNDFLEPYANATRRTPRDKKDLSRFKVKE